MSTSTENVYCKECGEPVVGGHGNKRLQLCNKHYIAFRRGAPGICTSCGRVTKRRRVHNPVCADCEAKEHALRYLCTQDDRFGRASVSPTERRLGEFWEHLRRWCGNRPKAIWEAFYPIDDLLNAGAIPLEATWDQLESYRQSYKGLKIVRYKAALYAYMEFLSMTGRLDDRKDMLFVKAYDRMAGDILPSFRRPFMDYIHFCLEERRIARWTLYLESDDLRDFFVWLELTYGSFHLAAIQTHHIREYLAFLSEKKARRTVKATWNILRNFFKWAKLQRLVFANPVLGSTVATGIGLPEGLSEEEQRRLAKRWLADDADPREAVIGLLAMVYGLSVEEIRQLRVHELDLTRARLSIGARPISLPLDPTTVRVLTRYSECRQAQVAGSVTEYVFVSRFSLRYNRPMERSAILRVLRPAKVNSRQLRVTCMIEAAMTGNPKLLEALGLSIGGSQIYMRVVEDALALRQLDAFPEIWNRQVP